MLYEIWLYGIIPAFFILTFIAFYKMEVNKVSVFKLIMHSIFWPFFVAVLLIAHTAFYFKFRERKKP